MRDLLEDSDEMSVTTDTDGPIVPETGDPGALKRTQEQLLVFARDMSTIYRRQRQQARHVKRLTDELESTHHATVQTLAFVVEAKDRYTRYHLERCREYGTALTREIDSGLDAAGLEHGFLLHDVGKIVVPESILSKPGPLTDDERSVMRTHPLIGVQIVAPLRFLTPAALAVIRNHHERYDGRGYPDGLKGQRIPLPARIFSVVDAFDAMTTDRPYRRALPVHESIRRLREGAGTQFDPEVVDSFEDLVERFPILELAGTRT
jgi:HD-GYP domain-containing protein (c-di-GMP phosphodiesterase class II)